MLDANSGEVHTAEVANVRSATVPIDEYATHLAMMHNAANDRLRALAQSVPITAQDSPVRAMVSAQGSQIVETLWMVPVASFDSAFLQAQLALHSSVANLLDSRLIPSARNADLRSELTAERAVVQMHYDQAQALLLGITQASDGGVDAPVGQ
jgi:putative membrane protein